MFRGFFSFCIFTLLCILLLPEIPLYGQTRPVKNPLRFPVYKSKQDSIKLHRIEKELSNLINTTDADVKKLDSLRALLEKTQSTEITGFRSIYLPATDHVSLDSLLRMKDLLSVKRVSIHNYHSKDLPAILFQCRNLESLELINTTVRHLPSTLNVLTHLRLVRIYNHAGKKCIKLKDNNHITELIIRGDHPKPLPRSYRSFIALTKLDLAGNNLRRFPQGARQNRKLLELNLQNNKLTLKQRLRSWPSII